MNKISETLKVPITVIKLCVLLSTLINKHMPVPCNPFENLYLLKYYIKNDYTVEHN